MESNDAARPRDAQLTSLVMSAMGVHEADPRTLPMLLELAYRYTTDILTDSLVYSHHAGRSDISTDDIRLAIQARVNYSFTHPPPKDYLLQLAAEKNAAPMPMISDKYGVRLPPESYCLTAVNYSAIPKKIMPSTLSTTNNARPDQHGDVFMTDVTPLSSPHAQSHYIKPSVNGKSSDTPTTQSKDAEELGEETDEELDDYISATPLPTTTTTNNSMNGVTMNSNSTET